MRSILYTTLLCLLALPTFAQRNAVVADSRPNNAAVITAEQNGRSSVAIDTIIPAIFFEPCASELFVITAEDGGYLAGTNTFGDREKAQFLRFDEEANYQVNGVAVYFSEFDDEAAGQLLTAKVYTVDPTTDGPGTLLGTSEAIAVGDVAVDESLVLVTIFNFAEPIMMDTPDFFVAVDFADVYNVPAGDVGILTTEEGCGDGFNAWELWEDDTWHAIEESETWEAELEFFMGAVIEDQVVGVRETLIDYSLRASPNPANEEVQLNFTLPRAETLEIALFDLQGRQVMVQQFDNLPSGPQSLQLEIGDLVAGIYSYQLRTASGVQSGKLIVE